VAGHPTALPRLLADPDPEKAQRAMAAMLDMRKIDIEMLERAAERVPPKSCVRLAPGTPRVA
jgi:hypothetical protein